MNEVIQEELELPEDFDTNIIPPSDVVVFNEVRACADLMRMYTEDQLNMKPDFQRDIVWLNSQQTRFIDSLAKQLPIPNICIAHDLSTKKRIIIDGLQRVSSIIKFLHPSESWKLTSLPDVDSILSGKTNSEIKSSNPETYQEIQNLSIPVTVIRCDLSKKNHSEYIFTIFHRLNTGGSKLNNQEIRNGVFNGSFNSLLKKLATSDKASTFFGVNRRYRSEELILRFYAFHFFLENYDGKLTSFLNDKMQNSRNMEQIDIDKFSQIFNETFLILSRFQLEDQVVINSKSRTIKEAILYGISKNRHYLSSCSDEKLTDLINSFFRLEEFDTKNLVDGLAAKEKMTNRLTAAKSCFSK